MLAVMTRLRTLLLLLLGGVTCLVLVQVGMDDWIHQQSIYRTNGALQEGTKLPPGQVTKVFNDSTTYPAKLPIVQFENISNLQQPTEALQNRPTQEVKPPTVIKPSPKYLKSPEKQTPLKEVVTTGKKKESSHGLTRQTISNSSQVIIKARLPHMQILSPEVQAMVQMMVNRTGAILPPMDLGVPLNSVHSYPQVSVPEVKRIIITTYFRSGSTFLGDVLQQNRRTFYHFEPLHYLSNGIRVGKPASAEGISLLADIFRCNFTTPLARKYVRWASMTKNNFLFRWNQFLWMSCRLRQGACFIPEFISHVCKNAPVQVMKVTRLHLDFVNQLIAENPDLGIRRIFLVRDPRGIMNSRRPLDWCKATDCSNPRHLCQEMEKDLQVYHATQPNDIILQRYEDVCLQPVAETRNLFAQLGLPFTPSVAKYLVSHTKGRTTDALNPYSTRRNSAVTPFAWQHKMNFSQVKKIQDVCRNVIQDLHYMIVNSTQEMRTTDPLTMVTAGTNSSSSITGAQLVLPSQELGKKLKPV